MTFYALSQLPRVFAEETLTDYPLTTAMPAVRKVLCHRDGDSFLVWVYGCNGWNAVSRIGRSLPTESPLIIGRFGSEDEARRAASEHHQLLTAEGWGTWEEWLRRFEQDDPAEVLVAAGTGSRTLWAWPDRETVRKMRESDRRMAEIRAEREQREAALCPPRETRKTARYRAGEYLKTLNKAEREELLESRAAYAFYMDS